MISPPVEEKARTLEGARLYGYTSGVLGQLLPINLINSYIFIYYVYAVGLNALLVGIGTAIGAFIMALASPFFGYVVDNKKPGRFGKRRPFLLLSLPFLFLTIILMWISPTTDSFGAYDWGITLYLWALLGVFFIFYAMLRSAHLSMTPEQSQVEENRIKIGSLIGIFSILGTILGIFIPLILQSLLLNPDDIYNTPQDRQFLLTFLPIIGLIFGILLVIFTLFAHVSTDEKFLLEDEGGVQNGTATKKEKKQANLKNIFKNLFNPFMDKNYSWFMISILLMTIGIRILSKNIPLFLTFVLFLRESGFITFIFPLVIFAILGFVFWSKRAQTKGIMKSYIQATWIISIALIATWILLIDMPVEILLWVARIEIAFILFSLVVGYILPSPAISELVDKAPEELLQKSDGNSLSGSYFGTLLFVLNIANAIGDILFGVMLMGENAESRFWVGILFPIAGVFFLVSIIFARKVRL